MRGFGIFLLILVVIYVIYNLSTYGTVTGFPLFDYPMGAVAFFAIVFIMSGPDDESDYE